MKLFWVITHRCNLSCVYCYYRIGFYPSVKDELTTQEGKQLLRETHDLGFEGIIFTGGEPLLRNDFFELLTHAQNFVFSFLSLCTNATLISPNKARELKKSGIIRVSTSLDSCYAEYNQKHRGRFLQITRGIKNLVEADLHVRVVCVLTQKNYQKIYNLVNFLEQIGVADIVFIPIALHPFSKLYFQLSLDCLSSAKKKEVIRNLEDWAQKYGYQPYLNFLQSYYSKSLSSHKICPLSKNLLSVEADGRIYACLHNSKSYLGQYPQKSLGQILQNLGPLNTPNCLSTKCLCDFAVKLKNNTYLRSNKNICKNTMMEIRKKIDNKSTRKFNL